MTPSTTQQWQAIRPWAPPLCLAVKEITSVSVTFILSSTVSDPEIDPSLASRGLIAAAEEESKSPQETEPAVASSSAISSPLCTTGESMKSQTRSFIADAVTNRLSVTVNGSPWQRAFIHIDEQSDEAVIIVYALMPGRQYDIELILIPSGQQPSDNNAATTTHLNRQITTEDDSDNAPSEIHTDPESASLDHSTPSNPDSTPSTSPSPTVPGTPTTVPHMTLEEKLKHLQQNLTTINEERETLLASLKTMRKDSQKADSALRSEIDALKRNSERHALAEAKGRQKVLALQEAVKRAQNATKDIEAKVKELEEEMPALNDAKDKKEIEYAALKKEADKVRKEREILEEKEKRRQEAMKAELAGLAVKLEKLGAKKEKLETGIVPELEQKLKEIEKEIEEEEQNLLKLESERNANIQSHWQHQYQLTKQRQRGYHTQNFSEDHHPTASSVPIQRPRHHSSAEFPTPIGRPTPAPIQRPTLASSSNNFNSSSIWTQRPLQPQSNSHQAQNSPRQQPTTTTITQPIYSLQLHNPRSLSFHNSMVAPSTNVTASNLIRRSSLKNPVSPPFSASTNHPSFNTTNASGSSGSGSNTPGSSSKSVTSSPRSHASIVASSSTLSSKAPAFEPTRSMSVISKLTSGIPNGNSVTTTPNSNVVNTSTGNSPLMSKGKAAAVISRASTVPARKLPTPIQRPVPRASSDDNGIGSGGQMQGHRHSQSQWSHGGFEGR